MIKIKSFPTRHNLFNSLYSIVQSSGTGRWQWPKLTKWWLKILQKYSTSSAWNVVSTSKSYWYPRYHKALNRTDIYINFLPSKVWALSPVLDCAWLQISKYKPASPCRDDSVAAPLHTCHHGHWGGRWRLKRDSVLSSVELCPDDTRSPQLCHQSPRLSTEIVTLLSAWPPWTRSRVSPR